MSIQKISGYQIKEGAINSFNIRDDSITSIDIKDGSITSADLAPGTMIDLNITAVNQNLPNNIWTKIRFNMQIKDTHNEFNLSDYRFSPKAPGRYLLCIGVQFSYNTQGVRTFAIYKNGVNTGKGNTMPDIFKTNITHTNLNVTVMLDLLVNDYIEIFAFQNSGQSNQYIIADNTWMTISKLM